MDEYHGEHARIIINDSILEFDGEWNLICEPEEQPCCYICGKIIEPEI